MKKALIIILGILLLIVLGGFFVWRYQKNVAHDLKTTGLLFENDTLYFSHIKISLLPPAYTVLDFYYDSRDSATQIFFTAKRLYARIDATSLMSGLESITVTDLEMAQGKLVMKKLRSEEGEADDFDLKEVESLAVNRFSIRDFAFSVATEKSGYEFEVESFSTKLELTANDGNIALEAKPEDTECQLQNLKLCNAWKHNDLACAQLAFSRESGLEMFDFQIVPQHGPGHFDQLSYLVVRTDLKTPSIKIPGFTWSQDSVFHLHVPRAQVEGTVLRTYQNMMRPFGPKPKKSPPSWFSNLDFVLQIDTLKLPNTRIEYSERNGHNSPLTELHLTGDISAYHLGNHANRPEHLEIDGKMLIMDGCPLEGRILFNYNEPQDPFRFIGHIGKTDFAVFNPTIEQSLGIRVKAGQCQKADFVFWGNDHHSEGQLKMAYSDLYIRRVDKDNFFQRSTDWALNSVALNSSSYYETEHSIGVERNNMRSVVAFWWMSLESGLKAAIIKPNNLIKGENI